MAGEEKKARGPMSEDARILLAKRKFGGMTVQGQQMAKLAVVDEDASHRTEAMAATHDDVASFIRIIEKLSPEGLATLGKLIA